MNPKRTQEGFFVFLVSTMLFAIGLIGLSAWNLRVPDAGMIHVVFANIFFITLLIHVYTLRCNSYMWTIILFIVGAVYAAFSLMSDSADYRNDATQYFKLKENIHAIFQYVYLLVYYYALWRTNCALKRQSCGAKESCYNCGCEGKCDPQGARAILITETRRAPSQGSSVQNICLRAPII